MKGISVKASLRKTYFPVVSILAALILSAVVMKILGFDPILAITSLISGSFGSFGAIADTLNKAMPVVMTGLSYAIAKRCGIINLGAEGQLYIGALCATAVGTNFAGTPAFIHIPLTLAAGFLGGALYGLLVGMMKLRFGASELITTIMLNYIAISFVGYCIAYPMKDFTATSNFPQSFQILESARLPRIVMNTRLHAGIFIVIAALLFYHIFLFKTKKGYEMRVIGNNQIAGKYAGMSVNKIGLLSIFIAGGFAGLGGCIELIGLQLRLMNGFSINFGFDGIAVALLGSNNSVGILFAGLLFGALKSGANKMQMMTNVPTAIVYMIQGFIILFVSGRALFDFFTLHKASPVKTSHSESEKV